MYVWVCTYVCMSMRVCMCTEYACMHVYVYMYEYVRMYVYICTYECACIPKMLRVHPQMHTCVHSNQISHNIQIQTGYFTILSTKGGMTTWMSFWVSAVTWSTWDCSAETGLCEADAQRDTPSLRGKVSLLYVCVRWWVCLYMYTELNRWCLFCTYVRWLYVYTNLSSRGQVCLFCICKVKSYFVCGISVWTCIRYT